MLQVETRTELKVAGPCAGGVPDDTQVEAVTLQALRVAPDGTSTWTPLDSGEHTQVGTAGPDDPLPSFPMAGQVLPISTGGAVLDWAAADGTLRLANLDDSGLTALTPPAGLSTGATLAGEDGLVYATSASGTVAFSAITSNVSWTHPAIGTVVDALPEGGAMLQVADTLRMIDGVGLVSGELSFVAVGAQALGGGMWIRPAVSGLEAVNGAQLAWPRFTASVVRGNRHGQGASEPLRLVHFATDIIVEPPDEVVVVEDLARDLAKAGVPGPVYARDQFTAERFLAEASLNPSALVFIGHSKTAEGDPGGAFALRFNGSNGDTYLVREMEGAPMLASPLPWQNVLRRRVASDAPIVYLGACSVGDHMETLFGFDVFTKGRALIWLQSSNPTIGLNPARLGWQYLAVKLMNGKPVWLAVKEVNDEFFYAHADKLQYAGDPNARIR